MQHATQPVKYAERSKERKEPYLFVTLFVLLGAYMALCLCCSLLMLVVYV